MSDPAPRRWLVKEEPTHYAFSDLVRDGRTEWSGVHNPTALKNLRAMRPGEEVLYYHTGGERRIVGIARVAGTPRPDPEDPRGSWTVPIAPVRALPEPIPLERLKAEPVFADSPLARIGRLSIVELTGPQWAWVLDAAGGIATRATSAASGSGRSPPRGEGGRTPRPATGSGAGGRSPARSRARGTGR